MNIDSIFKRTLYGAATALLVVVCFIGVHVFRVTLPKTDAEIDETHRASVEIALTAMEARKLSKAENAALPITQAKLNKTLDNVNALLVKAGKTVDNIDANEGQITDATLASLKSLDNSIQGIPPVLEATKKSIEGLGPVETASTDAIEKLGGTANAATDAINAPEIKATEKNLQSATGSLADVAEEGKDYVHKLLHPKWPSVVGSWIERIGVDIGKIFLD